MVITQSRTAHIRTTCLPQQPWVVVCTSGTVPHTRHENEGSRCTSVCLTHAKPTGAHKSHSYSSPTSHLARVQDPLNDTPCPLIELLGEKEFDKLKVGAVSELHFMSLIDTGITVATSSRRLLPRFSNGRCCEFLTLLVGCWYESVVNTRSIPSSGRPLEKIPWVTKR